MTQEQNNKQKAFGNLGAQLSRKPAVSMNCLFPFSDAFCIKSDREIVGGGGQDIHYAANELKPV